MAQLTYADLVKPTGWVRYEFFPEQTPAEVQADLTGYLAAAYADARVAALGTEALQNDAARAYANWRAAESLWLLTAANPASDTVNDQGAKSWTDSQRETWAVLMARYEAEFLQQLPPVVVAARQRVQGTASIPSPRSW